MRPDRRTVLLRLTGSLCALAASGLRSASAQSFSSGTPAAASDAAGLPRVYTPTRTRALRGRYPWRQQITTTLFWIGEQPTANNPTPNHASSWDPHWQKNFGGYDDPNPEGRAWDYRPAAFVPRLNPFYCALPFNDITQSDVARRVIPWRHRGPLTSVSRSLCKSQWLAIRQGRKICYAQWEDCGPFVTDDWPYVFGYARPRNRENNAAGLDVSPSVRDYLQLRSGARCDWRFVELAEVPPGPWRRYGTNNHFARAPEESQEDLEIRMSRLRKAREEWLRQAR